MVLLHVRIMVSHWIMIGVVVLLSGCVGLDSMVPPKVKLEKPRLSLVSIHVIKTGKASIWEPKFRVRLNVENPNDIEFPIGGLDFRIELQGMTFASGVSAEFFTIPPKGGAEFDVDVSTGLLKAMKQISTLLRSGQAKAEYRIVGQIYVELAFVGAVAFDQRGVLQKPLKWDD